MNKDYYVTNSSGDIISTGSCPESMLAKQTDGTLIFAGSADPANQRHDNASGMLVPRTPTPTELWLPIKSTRMMLLADAGAKLSELLLPDSFPKLTAAQKQAKIAALKTYRQALRDITKQTDPANIKWPEAPL